MVYEEICRDDVNDALSGNNLTYISYGETASDKLNVLIGDYQASADNITKRGLFFRMFEALNEKIIAIKSR